ncbi:lipocalin family protein [Chitinophaga filiformis]|uniref:Lipocalin-like domain-containing protein n=1 Tax=Chitinophaga filiformis TaxID=104663 RepID=A0A1G8CJ27_CHIFI|nr:lipocalin family protein [Chitinophaga filiformis]SDH45203.1 hypothetical protein SAMN04488121_112154 [Chitinophaga filiformis]
MKYLPFIAIAISLLSCSHQKEESSAATSTSPLVGTWKLISARSIQGKDTTITAPVAGQETIKIFNDSYFAFFTHDLNHGTDSSAVYGSGSGTYTLVKDVYSEHLEYCSYRGWEDKDFSFVMQISKDTIIQSGIEKIDSLNINHEIVETYARIR